VEQKEGSVAKYLYLSLVPEALIASMLPPEDFASYYAVGTQSKTQGQAVFIEVDPGLRLPELPIEAGLARCIPHKDGAPKRSVYISVYRVLERLPLSALGKLHLVTRDGRSLSLGRSSSVGEESEGLHFYHELAPTRPAVVSTLGPRRFFDLLMGREGGFEGLPAVAFVELRLGELASDPERGGIGDLPYENIDHLRSCLSQLRTKEVASKIFDRANPGLFPYRTIKEGIYVGKASEGLSAYLMPAAAAIKEGHYAWWRSAHL
jgi:hypothetical protein